MSDTPVGYVSHPVAGDLEGNLARARRWLAWLAEVFPAWALSMPWMPYVETLDESTHRERGLRDCVAQVRRCDGIILVGGHLSSGMAEELAAALDGGLFVLDLTGLGREPPAILPWSETTRRAVERSARTRCRITAQGQLLTIESSRDLVQLRDFQEGT